LSRDAERRGALRRFLSYVWWPALFGLSLCAVFAGMRGGHAVIVFNLTYLALALVVGLLERVVPHQRAWLRNDGQIGTDLAHTLLNKGVAQVIITVAVFVGLADFLTPDGDGEGIWPNGWPLALQTGLGLLIAEAGLYWKHRLAHEWPLLWRFHALHHSTTRLWFFNTGRFHLVDTVTGLAVGMPVLLLLGAPEDVLVLVSAITAIIGLLTHCNIEMRCGVLSYVFNTPALHRWHHSKVPHEGNRNYGENLVLFDMLFGTFYLPARQPPLDIGIRHDMPPTFLGQLAAPFTVRPL